jgi:hypothetical protein
MKFTGSFITNSFQARDISESAAIISVFKENFCELELKMINLQTDLSLKTALKDTNFQNAVPSAQYLTLQWESLKFNRHFGSTGLSESGFSTVQILVTVHIIINL